MIDDIFHAYFEILPTQYFLLFISFGISAIIIYTLFTYFDD